MHDFKAGQYYRVDCSKLVEHGNIIKITNTNGDGDVFAYTTVAGNGHDYHTFHVKSLFGRSLEPVEPVETVEPFEPIEGCKPIEKTIVKKYDYFKVPSHVSNFDVLIDDLFYVYESIEIQRYEDVYKFKCGYESEE